MKHASDFPLKCVSFVHCNIVQYIMHFIRAKHLDRNSSYLNILHCITLRAIAFGLCYINVFMFYYQYTFFAKCIFSKLK